MRLRKRIFEMVKAVRAPAMPRFWAVARGAKPDRLPVDRRAAVAGLRCPFVVRSRSPLTAIGRQRYAALPKADTLAKLVVEDDFARKFAKYLGQS